MQSLRILALGNQAVHRLCAPDLDVGSSRIEVGVGGDALFRPADQAEQNGFGGSTLVRWNDVFERHEMLHRRLESVE
jgi:hypothetical protein